MGKYAKCPEESLRETIERSEAEFDELGIEGGAEAVEEARGARGGRGWGGWTGIPQPGLKSPQLRGNEIGRSYVPIIGDPGGNPTPCSEPDAGPPNPVAEALDQGRVAIVYGINFDVDSDALRTDAGPALEQILAALEQFYEISITIEGHTDSDGSDAHNLELSRRRAESVAAWLDDRGVVASRLEPVGRGESDPIADNVSDAGKAAIRRVEMERP